MKTNIDFKKICFLVNPQKSNIKAYCDWVLAEVAEKRPIWFIHLFDLQWPPDLQNFDEVWVMGGDGTFNYFVNKYPDCSIPIGLFQGGTGNDFHWKVFGSGLLRLFPMSLVSTVRAKWYRYLISRYRSE